MASGWSDRALYSCKRFVIVIHSKACILVIMNIHEQMVQWFIHMNYPEKKCSELTQTTNAWTLDDIFKYELYQKYYIRINLFF